MNGELFLLILAVAYSLVQSSFVSDTLDLVKAENQTYAHQILNQQLSLVSYCGSDITNCHQDKFSYGYVPTELFLDDFYIPSHDNIKQKIVSCYNSGYVFSFFAPGNQERIAKFGFNKSQVFSYAEAYSHNRVNIISARWDAIPNNLCSIPGQTFTQDNVDFLLINYVGK
ncbi:hypothetical protein [Yokenella regensburgei]|uniref:hypothetical protein n=1 Tax=Yokenella regensburgei TaxID=158877 RepID=UPI001432F9B7|nr:hypothetical protein [Yokenella regensburgei]QIU90099.1 hypothetical protein HEC60_12665 [Yokenella regensburgei]